MLRLMLAMPLSRKLRVVDVSGLGYAYALVGLAGVLSCGFALGASAPLRAAMPAGSVAALGDVDAERVVAQAVGSLDAFALRLGELQARVARLEALGQQVRLASDLPGDELDFTAPPPETAGPLRASQLSRALDELSEKLDYRAVQFNVLDQLIGDRVASNALVPSVQPLRRMDVSSRYGSRMHPVVGRRLFHPGMDFAAPAGTPIYAAAAGLVTEAGWRSGYGNMLQIDHGGGLTTRYGHNRENLVKAGDFVAAGQMIARVGRTGRVTGAHLHFEVRRDGRSENPAAYLDAVTRQVGPLAAAR